MNKPHKHAEVIKAWADGASIQYRDVEGAGWFDLNPRETPIWYVDFEYRVKPDRKEPGIVCRDALYRALGISPVEECNMTNWNYAAKVLIEAYKAGELKDI